MRTVAWLIAELKKFPPDAVCFAYEGECTGIVIERGERKQGEAPEHGVIHCSESDEYDNSHETILLP